jgi:hypothetical protein
MESRAVDLNPEQKKVIRPYVQAFKKYVKGEEFLKDQEDRLSRVSYFQRDLPKKVRELSETDVDELVTKLWASRSFVKTGDTHCALRTE